MAKKKVNVKASHRFNKQAPEIYDTFLDPKKAKKFMFATITGKMIVAEIDAKVGGKFTFIDRRPEGDAPHYGEYVELQRPTKIAFKFAVQKDAKEADLVSIDIKDLPRGCEVVLTHEVDADYAHLSEQIESGWDGILDGLGEALRG